MISLMVAKYCHDCPQFDPEATTLWENDKPTHYVRCSYRDTCKEIHRYLRKMESEKTREENDNV